MEADPYASPLAYFVSKLKQLRERTGLTQTQVAERTNYALSTVSAYENGSRIASPDYAQKADALFGSDQILTELQQLVEQVSVRSWFRNRVAVEKKAEEIREYESYQIPGLLQTSEYARAIISVGRPKVSSEETERAVVLRMTRQEALELRPDLPVDKEQTPRYWAVIDESALLRVVGSPEIMATQIRHLIELAEQSNITIQIITNEKGPTSAYGRAFTILVSHNNSSMVYLEDPNSAHYVRERDEVAKYVLIFDHLRASALDDTQTLKLLRARLK